MPITPRTASPSSRAISHQNHLVYQETFFPPDNDQIIRDVTIHLWESDAYTPTLAGTDAIETEDFTLFSVIDRDTILTAIA